MINNDLIKLNDFEIFIFIKNVRTNFHHILYPILYPYIINELPLDIIPIILDYVNNIELIDEKALYIKNISHKWNNADKNIDKIFNFKF